MNNNVFEYLQQTDISIKRSFGYLTRVIRGSMSYHITVSDERLLKVKLDLFCKNILFFHLDIEKEKKCYSSDDEE
eukprot:snap_masked-scaffold_4-processed-gene-0.16-mRNA-1 protein AED:1.00 eAED:1.00 QI:0/0/0/0/1/1/2/0/74